MESNIDFFKIKYNNKAPKQGLVLVSEPFAPDSIFKRSIILLVEHNKEGSVGFILNKPLKKTLPDVSDEFGDFEVPVSMGGPVSRDNIYYFHTLGDVIPGSIKIRDDLYWGGDFEIIKMMISAGTLKKNQIRFFVGYSGWSPKQLDNELNKDYWLVSDIETSIIMEHDKKIWEKVVPNLGDKYSTWANFPENPIFN